MAYYDIWVSTNQFRSNSTLTYESDELLDTGSIVLVPFKNQQILGLVKESVTKPSFKVKTVAKLLVKKPLPSSDIKLLEWLIDYYPSASSTHLQLFLPKMIDKLDSEVKEHNKAKNKDKQGSAPPALTIEQKATLDQINKSRSRTILIHGDTGSGKTRVYLELIRNVLKDQKSVLLLVPEIGLSPQMINSLEDFFPGQVIPINSSLSNKNKRVNWLKILTTERPYIVVGPRSALFMPITNLGLIIIDEAHDQSYKQESAPFYQSTRVAAKLADITDSRLILGTATPLISDYYLFKIKKIPILRMVNSAVAKTKNHKLDIKLVDLADKSLFTKSTWLSNDLLKSIDKSLKSKEQSLIFLNRRGTATVIMCNNCKWKALCPNCNICLTYHQDKHTLVCHSCGLREKLPSKCPKCSNSDILFRGIGTKAIETELAKFYPKAIIKRFDKDNNKSDSLRENYTEIKTGKVDIIIGTQLITKGLDLPSLSTVGIVMADQNLSFPDFSSEERNYQIISQVIGRVGRGHISDSQIVIQTFNVDNLILKAAIDKDYSTFYNEQISIRKKYLFPPFVYIMKIYCKKSSSKIAEDECYEIKKLIKSLGLSIYVSEPSPAFREQIANKYIWQMIIKSKSRADLTKIVCSLPNNWFYDIDPINLL